MLRRAVRLMLSASLISISGCSVWPSAEHRQLTESGIRQTLETLLNEQKITDVHCIDTPVMDARIQKQSEVLERLSDQLKLLTAATPALASADCPEPVRWRPADGKTLIGSSEWIYLSPPDRHYQARIDSGAAISSLSAINIQKFERNGKPWVRFDLQHDDESETVHMEVPVERHVRIRQASAKSVDRRVVVRLTVNLGPDLQQDTEFSLTDRLEMAYPILLGRSFLRDVTLIDVGRRLIQPKFIPDLTVQEIP